MDISLYGPTDRKTRAHQEIIRGGDFNWKVGSKKDSSKASQYKEEGKNNSAEMLTEYCEPNQLKILNTFYCYKNIC